MRVPIAASVALILFASSSVNAQPATPKAVCLRQDMVRG